MANILIAEDDAHMLRILSIWLQRKGHHVFEAGNGLIAKQELLVRAFDFVVSDVNMPGLDGIGLARWLRGARMEPNATKAPHDRESDPETRSSSGGTNSSAPMILLSSRCDQSLIAEQLAPLDIAIYPKPFSPSRLAAEIERRLGTRTTGVDSMRVEPQHG